MRINYIFVRQIPTFQDCSVKFKEFVACQMECIHSGDGMHRMTKQTE